MENRIKEFDIENENKLKTVWGKFIKQDESISGLIYEFRKVANMEIAIENIKEFKPDREELD